MCVHIWGGQCQVACYYCCLLSSEAGSLIFTWSPSVWLAWSSNEPQGSTCFGLFGAIIMSLCYHIHSFLFGFYFLPHPQFVIKIHFPATYNPFPFLPQHHQEPKVVKLSGDSKVGQFSFLRSWEDECVCLCEEQLLCSDGHRANSHLSSHTTEPKMYGKADSGKLLGIL